MSEYSFAISGHSNVLATHGKTLEFTKDAHLTLRGDCIVGIKAGFSKERLEKFLGMKKVRIVIKAGNFEDFLTAVPNAGFSSDREMVIRVSDADSERTFAVRGDKAASDLDRHLIAELKSGGKGSVTIRGE